MATATKQAHAAPSPAHFVHGVSEPASPAFHIYRDNGGNHHWEIVDSGGEILAHSGSFASEDDAQHAARDVHKSARLASFESQVAEDSHTVVA